MEKKMLIVALVIVALLLGYDTYQGLNNASHLSTIVKESASTRVVTVTQRCQLTALDALDAHLQHRIIGEFVPMQVQPFATLEHKYNVSYLGCEKQLKTVKKINRQASGKS